MMSSFCKRNGGEILIGGGEVEQRHCRPARAKKRKSSIDWRSREKMQNEVEERIETETETDTKTHGRNEGRKESKKEAASMRCLGSGAPPAAFLACGWLGVQS